MKTYSDDPAFVLDVTVLGVVHKAGEFVDKDTKETRKFDSYQCQCTWDCVQEGRMSICLAKPVAGYVPDTTRLNGACRLAVVSAVSSGGQLNVRFSGFEKLESGKR